MLPHLARCGGCPFECQKEATFQQLPSSRGAVDRGQRPESCRGTSFVGHQHDRCPSWQRQAIGAGFIFDLASSPLSIARFSSTTTGGLRTETVHGEIILNAADVETPTSSDSRVPTAGVCAPRGRNIERPVLSPCYERLTLDRYQTINSTTRGSSTRCYSTRSENACRRCTHLSNAQLRP